MPRMITVLEEPIRFRDGKKWKRRYCFLSKPDSKKRTITMFITKHFGFNVANQEIDEKSLRQYLIDEITGYEHGRHVDKESHVMALIGRNVVYCIAFDNTETMFRWAETLSKLLISVNFHVTLKKVSETSGLFNKIPVGTQGNLHVQLTRLCLIGEPADGNKFICEWSIENLIFVDIYDTICEKLKKVQIKSNGKMHKGKGHFEFEIAFSQRSIFEDTFRSFLTACKTTNSEFKTNFPLKGGSGDMSGDTAYSYSIVCCDKNRSNSDNSSSLEKRSSEIPIPRSREHSGPDQRPIENAQIKIRKSHKNIHKINSEIHKHYSTIEISNKQDHDICLFADDEEIEDQVHHKSQNLIYSGLSQESSGVFVNGASDCTRESELPALMSVQHDSGLGHISGNFRQSTSSTRHDIDNTVLPPCQKTQISQTNIFLTFYNNVNGNPLSLKSYSNYNRLLTIILDSRGQLIKRNNSFNCVHLPDIKRLKYCRKYSHTNFPLNLASKASGQYFKICKEKLSNKGLDSMFFKMQLQDTVKDNDNISLTKISDKLPFSTIHDFHYSMMSSLKSGTICFNLFSYHHFLVLLKDVEVVVNNINSKVTSNEAELEYMRWKDKIYRKNKVYNHWLERMESYSSTYDVDGRLTEPSILDINIYLVFEIIDNLLHLTVKPNQRFCDVIAKHQLYFKNNPIIEINDDELLLTGTTDKYVPTDLMTESSTFLEPRPLLCMSCSTPDFRLYCQHEQIHKFSNTENRYQNISSTDTFDTMNHTFPKQNISLNKPSTSSDNNEGSFKKLRRKYSPNVFIPFIRRKTSSTHSTLSEPICCTDTKEQNLYYNMAQQRDIFNKKSLSVVLDSCHYVNITNSQKYINMSKNSGTTESNDSSNYINVDSSSIDGDNISYPDEILDPSRNYGDLNFIKSKLRHTRQDVDNQNWLNLRRSSLSIISQKSLQNFGTSRSVSFSKRGYSNISRVHSDACNNNSNFRSTDYINTKTMDSSPHSLQSCFPHRSVAPSNLNYVSVIENQPCESSHRFTMPLSIYTQNENDDILQLHCNTHKKRSWRTTPHSSPVVDYCQIDLNGTYALRDIDRMLFEKMKTRNSNLTSSSSKNGSPEDVESFKSLDQIPDNYSLSSACFLDKKSHKHNRKSFRNIFSRKCGSTN